MRIVIVFAILCILGSIVFFTSKKENEMISRLYSKYPQVMLETEFNGKVTFVFDYHSVQLRDPVYASMIEINGWKCRIYGAAEIEDEEYGINELISVGDSIIKRTNSDTITIINSEGYKYFLIRRDKVFQ